MTRGIARGTSVKVYKGDLMVSIGLTTTYEKIDGLASSYIARDYVNPFIEQGALPVLIPVTDNTAVIDRYLDLLDGVVLTGGGDIDPQLYGEENKGLSTDVCRERDLAEMYIIKKSLERKIPILGICRGFQILNVFFGGTLYQDIPSQFGDSVVHQHAMGEREALHHEVSLKRGSYIRQLFGGERIMVNSRHHQGIKIPGSGLIITAKSDDGIAEALEVTGSNVLAVQWHPENILGICQENRKLFSDLVDRARNRQRI